MAGPRRDWSSLPDQIIQTIAEILHTRLDIIRLRAVCNSFRSAIPAPVLCSPHLKDLYYDRLPLPLGQELLRLAIKQYTVYLIEPISEVPDSTSSAQHNTTKGRLIKVRESHSGKVRLVDPFISLHYKHLNHMLPTCLSLSDYRVTEIAKEYGLEYAEAFESFFCWSRKVPGKVAVSTDHGDELVLMTLVNSKLHFWRSRNKKWIRVSGFNHRYPRDVIYHNRKFYVLMGYNRLVSVDPNTLKKSSVVRPPPIRRISYGHKSFVKSGNDLFLVHRTEYSVIDMYKLHEERGQWNLVNDGIGDKALFMCEGGNFFVSANEFNALKRNCVYLPGSGQIDFDNGYPGKGAEIYSFEYESTEYLTAFPGYSDIFWPPPTWPIPKY